VFSIPATEVRASQQDIERLQADLSVWFAQHS
jgi:hypothetical protein